MTTVGAYLPVGGMREGIVREFEMDIYTAIFQVDNQQGPTI